MSETLRRSLRWLGIVLAFALPATLLAALADHLGQTYRDQPPQPGSALLALTVGVLAGVGFGIDAGTPILLVGAVAASGVLAVGAHLAYAAGRDPTLPLDAACHALPLFCIAVCGVLMVRAQREGSTLRRVIAAPLVFLWCAHVVAHAAAAHSRDGGGPLLGAISPMGWLLVPWLSFAIVLDTVSQLGRRGARASPR